MSMNSASLPAITLDLKKQRIRIHNNTLHLLEDPIYIDLLVNPDQRVIAVRATEKKHTSSHKIIYNTQQDHELYSKILLEQLRILHPELKKHRTYRLYGKIVPEKKLIIFNMSHMALISGAAEGE